MTHINIKTQLIRELLFPIIGETTAKTYFSYYGIFKEELMFALYKDGNFYLRLAAQDIENALSYPDVAQLNDPNINQAQRYYYLPDFIIHNIEAYSDWLKNSMEEIKTNKFMSYYNQKQKIRSLPNMSFSLERILKKINIKTIEQFIEKGEINMFVELIKIGIDVDHITLFRLYGAINRQLIYTIPLKTKLALLHEANEALYAAGLRKKFNIKP